MKPSLAQLHEFENNIEGATIAILRRAGLPVLDPDQVAYDEAGKPQLPEHHCVVMYEASDTAPAEVRVTNAAGEILNRIEAGWEGDIVINHQVPMDDSAPPLGEPIGPYKRIGRQRGQVRAALLYSENDMPFGDQLPWYSVLSLRMVAPSRGTDQTRSLNQATERFRIRFMPKREAI